MLVAGGIGHHEWQAACSGAPFQPAGVTVVVTETCWAGGWCCAPATWWQGDGALWERRDSRHYLWHDPSGASGYSSADRHPDRKSTRLNSSHSQISYAVFCLKKKKKRPLRSAGACVGGRH